MPASPRRARATPALIYLTDHGLPHTVHEFVHDPSSSDYGQEAARELGVAPESIFKTLLWDVDSQLVVALAPVSTTISPKKLAEACQGKRAHLAEATVAERASGSVVGAISPVGMKRRFPAVVDSSVVDLENVFISAGRRGMEIALAPAHLIEATGAVLAHITQDSTAL